MKHIVPIRLMMKTHSFVTYTLMLAALLLAGRIAQAGPVSGTIYDIDYLKAQPGGFKGVSYPRFTNPNGSDGGQLVYNANAYFYASFVLDTTTGNMASITNASAAGYITYSFSFLPPGRHNLVFIEPNRDEVYQPSSKRINIIVPAGKVAVTNADFNLIRQWRFGNLIATEPSAFVFKKQAGEFLDKDNGWIAIAIGEHLADYANQQAPNHSALDIYRTADGGKTWAKISRIDAPYLIIHSPPQPDYKLDQGLMTVALNGIHFTDTKNGILMTDAYNSSSSVGPSIYVTRDGGMTWNFSSTLRGIAYSYFSSGIPIATFTDYMRLAWDRTDRNSGVMWLYNNYYLDPPQMAHRRLQNVYTLKTKDGGQTWTELGTYISTDIDSSNYGQRVAMFSGGNSFAMTTTGVTESGLLINATASTNGGPFYQLTTNPDGAMSSAYFHHARYYGQIKTVESSALFAMFDGIASYTPRLYRTDDKGVNWNRVDSWNGSNYADGRPNFNTFTDLMPDNGFWSWDDRNELNIYRSMDGGLSTAGTGSFVSSSVSFLHSGIDIHTGRVVFSTAGELETRDIAGSFYFDEEPASSPARIVPFAVIASNHILVTLFNAGGDWAKGITLTGLSLSNGITFTRLLPWNVGAIPPGSSESEISFLLSSLPPTGTRVRVTLTGRYNGGQQFQVTRYFTP
jgi:hypothetical protein